MRNHLEEGRLFKVVCVGNCSFGQGTATAAREGKGGGKLLLVLCLCIGTIIASLSQGSLVLMALTSFN